jgi:pyruvate/2-oxoglutarate dehydrogenase complex dihydrolipoamide acyltransferase (E2) component
LTSNPKGYQILPFPAARRVIVDAGRMGTRRPFIHGLLEIDVKPPREAMRRHKAETGESLSFTAFIIACLARAIAGHPQMHAYRDWRDRLILFNDVDVATEIETERDGVALPHVISAANKKTFRQIHDEIRSVQANPQRSQQTSWVALGPYAPGFVRSLFFWALRHNPHWFKALSGTVIVTAVGMFIRKSGWGYGFVPLHTLGITIGGISAKPGVANGEIAIREYLDLTISLDHDIVDGAPAARFAARFVELIESGYGLIDLKEGTP